MWMSESNLISFESKREEAMTRTLYVAQEHERKQPSRRRLSVKKLKLIPDYKEYTKLGRLGTNPNLH